MSAGQRSRKVSRSKAGRPPIAVITGTRAEFGLLEPVMRAMRKRRLEYRLIVTGIHLLKKFGRTIDQIREAGWPIDATVKMQTGRDDPAGEPPALARGISGIARELERLGCDIVLVLGDRIEAFAGACAAITGRKILVHIHGGDQGVGDIDQALRDAISQLADVHLVASQAAADRLRQMGQPACRIHRVGAPGLDEIRRLREEDRKHPVRVKRRLGELLGPIGGLPYAVVVQHPCGRSPAEEKATMENIVSAVERCRLAGVALYPNTDPGHSGIVQVLETLRKRDNWCVFRSLVRSDYIRLVGRSELMVGNSSSGIIESASIGVNAINIGPRQRGRLRCGKTVTDAGESPRAITKAIHQIIGRPRPRGRYSVYGHGRAGEQIADVLLGLIKKMEV